MKGEISGGENGIVYERLEAKRPDAAFQISKPAPMNFTAADIIFAYGMLVCGFLYWNLINVDSLGFGVTLFAIILCVAAIAYLKASGMKMSRDSVIFLGLILISAVNFTLFDGILIKGLNFIFLSTCFIYWISIYTGRRLENRLSLYIIGDLIHQTLVVPFTNFTCCFGGVKKIFVKNQRGKGFISGLVGVLFFLPVLILVISLLTDADAAFESLLGRLQFSFSENMLEYITQMVLGIPVAFYLYGLIYGNRYQRNTGYMTLDSVNKNVTAMRFAPDVTVYSALTALNLVYIIFFLAQTAYLFSAFGDSLPQSMTYSEYARRGFFELCAVSGINLGVIAFAHLIVKREKIKILRIETVALCLFTAALIVTAISKMGMYINYYGLTRLRVYTSWFMIVLLMIFILILLRQFIEFRGTKIAAAGFICLFLALCYGNVDGMIAKYNIDRYQAGKLEHIDIEALLEVSDGAVPYLYELYQETTDPELKTELRNALGDPGARNNHIDVSRDDFRNFNYQSYKAGQIRKQI
jgi:hypothetical protein